MFRYENILPSMSIKNILEEVEKIAEQGYSIEYMPINQYDNGHKDEVNAGEIPLVTYTLDIINMENGESIYSKSFNHIQDCLRVGVKWVRENLQKGKNNNAI
ncbi:hypothetical protein ACFHWD_03560 [Clostridium sp. MT-14]|uniref:hypothetical protein n=1 Tax=Clostridium sp. MT-14 TaxID=3348360 RepID=UPI0035F2F6E0